MGRGVGRQGMVQQGGVKRKQIFSLVGHPQMGRGGAEGDGEGEGARKARVVGKNKSFRIFNILIG